MFYHNVSIVNVINIATWKCRELTTNFVFKYPTECSVWDISLNFYKTSIWWWWMLWPEENPWHLHLIIIIIIIIVNSWTAILPKKGALRYSYLGTGRWKGEHTGLNCYQTIWMHKVKPKEEGRALLMYISWEQWERQTFIYSICSVYIV